MIKTANELRLQSRNKRVVLNEMREILKAMEYQMVIANREGRSYIDFKVPKTYASVGQDTDSMMRIVSGTLKELINAGYHVGIRDMEHTFIFTIRWEIEMTDVEKDALLSLMEEHMVDKKKK